MFYFQRLAPPKIRLSKLGKCLVVILKVCIELLVKLVVLCILSSVVCYRLSLFCLSDKLVAGFLYALIYSAAYACQDCYAKSRSLFLVDGCNLASVEV